MRHAARTDANQGWVVDALRNIGASVYYIKQPLDLLVSFRGRTMLLEVKVEGKKPNKNQEEFLAKWPGEAHVVSTLDEVFAAVLGKDAMR